MEGSKRVLGLVAFFAAVAQLLAAAQGQNAADVCTDSPTGVPVTITFHAEGRAADASWTITSATFSTHVLLQGSNYTNHSTTIVAACFPPGAYNLWLKAASGNGWEPGTFIQLSGTGVSEQRQLALPSSSIGLQSFSISGPEGVAALVPAQAGPAPTVILGEANGSTVGGAAARSATSVGASAPGTSSSSGAKVGSIVGGVLAAVVVLAVATAGAVFVVRRRGLHPSLSFQKVQRDKNGNFCVSWGRSVSSPQKGKDVWRRTMHFALAAARTRHVTAEVFTYKDLALATGNFSKANILGEGGFGRVYRAALEGGRVAAVKQLDPKGKQGDKEFRVEVDLLSRLYHPNLVQLIGYCADSDHRLLAYEFMPNGSVQDHLHGRGPKPLDWRARVRIALGSARGLHYLHEGTEARVFHRDFKSSNILLDEKLEAKVADFGLAKLAPNHNDDISTRVLGTFGYVAPEYVMTGHLTEKSDVYSYGVVLLELITGRRPVDIRRPPKEQSLVSWAGPNLSNKDKLLEMADPALGGRFPIKSLCTVAAIAAMCVQAEADYRPLMGDIVETLLPLAEDDEGIPPHVVIDLTDSSPSKPDSGASSSTSQEGLLGRTKASSDKPLCLVCHSKPRAATSDLPCQHDVACKECTRELAGGARACPVCDLSSGLVVSESSRERSRNESGEITEEVEMAPADHLDV
ncbi:Protein kinase superfamily protein [Klebsormidium nitens]|uniref:Protein kinase superfamily protein n=1 Tax=Klebsormidium nitens TaxID=105231 RepID=A0A1Y1HQB8_KLENI|nr:Protein kinase superfamily protein [Klebsormidium nitens]|eukprot:GAQ80825.1 Protein kinase superfamily protein [Klebsormidium nitens]